MTSLYTFAILCGLYARATKAERSALNETTDFMVMRDAMQAFNKLPASIQKAIREEEVPASKADARKALKVLVLITEGCFSDGWGPNDHNDELNESADNLIEEIETRYEGLEAQW